MLSPRIRSVSSLAVIILVKEKIFENIWVQPAAGDAGGALGAALAVWHLNFDKKRAIVYPGDAMMGSYLGPEFSDDQIEDELDRKSVV